MTAMQTPFEAKVELPLGFYTLKEYIKTSAFDLKAGDVFLMAGGLYEIKNAGVLPGANLIVAVNFIDIHDESKRNQRMKIDSSMQLLVWRTKDAS